MREILFRGKRLKIGPFAVTTTDEWVYGCYVKDSISTYIYTSMEHPRMVSVDPSTVGQYTGLRDKNGKRIFEGDIVKFKRTDALGFTRSRIGQVLFNGDLPIFYILATTGDAWDWGVCEEIVVIGNIYDDQEIMEEESNGTS